MTRIRSLDLARGFTVLFIPAIHTGMLYSNLSVHHSGPGQFLIAIAEGPGGQLLMLMMGISFTLKSNHSTTAALFRSVLLLLAGYALNILKFVVPYSLDDLPQEVLQELQITDGDSAHWRLAGIGDILHFAGLAQVILYYVYKQKHYQWLALSGAVVVVLVSPFVWDLHIGSLLPDYLLELATGQPPRVFFPLFPWLVYPLVGLCIGHFFQRDQQQTALISGLVGSLLIGWGLWWDNTWPVDNPAGFYRTPVAATCWHLGVVLVAIFFWHFISTYVRDNVLFRLLSYSSKHITALYIVQWVMICWLLPVIGYQQQGLTISALLMIVITLNTYLLTYCFQLAKQYYDQK